MDDAVKKIARDFRDLAAVNPILRAMLKKLENGGATYLDADRYALELAMVLGRALHLNLGGRKLEGEAYQELIREVLPKGMHSIYEDVADYAQTIQQGINERMGIGLSAVKPDFNDKEADAIVEKATSADTYDDIPGGINQDMQHMAQNVATDTMKANAKLANDVGMEAIVSRTYDGVGVHTQNGGKYREECGWCKKRCKTDVPYSEAIANDMFRRHPGCGCRIEYTVNGKMQVQTNWQENQWADSERKVRESVENNGGGGIITVNKTIAGHESTPKKSSPDDVIDHIGKDGKTETRTFYDENGWKKTDITNHDHHFPKQHPYGEHGEHAHDYEWNDDGTLKSRTTREITEEEREENSDIL